MAKRRTLTAALLLTLTLGVTACRGGGGSPSGGAAGDAGGAPSSAAAGGSIASSGAAFTPQAPSGFSVRLWADVPDARSLALSPDGKNLFVGTRTGNVYKVTVEGDKAARVETFQEGLDGSNGVAFVGDDLYIGMLEQVVKFNASEGFPLKDAGHVVFTGLPPMKHHGWRYLKAGPDGRVYIGIGAPCNVCEQKDERFASLCSFLPDGSDFRVEARGVRNTVGFDWKPGTKDLYFTDNGRDSLGDDIPPCEMNLLAPGKTGSHYGFPYVWGDNQPDPEFGSKAPKGVDFVKPVVKFQAHVAPLGCYFPRHERWKTLLAGKALVAQHGSWNRSTPVGYQVVSVDPTSPEPKVEPFLWGFLGDENGSRPVHGRPVDITELKDGTLLVSDDNEGKIWAITATN